VQLPNVVSALLRRDRAEAKSEGGEINNPAGLETWGAVPWFMGSAATVIERHTLLASQTFLNFRHLLR
jgi:hypothetical protein